MRTGRAELPLHSGRAPRWLFRRMVSLARAVVSALIEEHGRDEFLRRLADPFWFQAFGCVLGFDWHSSGLTTTTCGALKEALKGTERDFGVWVAGGKGAASRKTPHEISLACERTGLDPAPLSYASRMSAKVDSAAVQDGYRIYHHSFVFTSEGRWAVVQQGMNEHSRLARRYHWLSETLDSFVCEPHSAVCSRRTERKVLNLVASESAPAREAAVLAARTEPDSILPDLQPSLFLPRRHHILVPSDVDPRNLRKILLKTYERQPADFEELLALPGVGPKTVRALSLVAELVFGEKPSWRDPARFSFAHGGKDGIPFPVDRDAYDRTVSILEDAVRKARLGPNHKHRAFSRLKSLLRP